jgi:hypothetical protein
MLPRNPLILDARHDLANQVDAQATHFPFLQRGIKIRDGVLGGIELHSIIFDAGHEFLITHGDLQGEAMLSTHRVCVRSHVGNHFIQGQIQIACGFRRDGIPYAKIRDKTYHTLQFR